MSSVEYIYFCNIFLRSISSYWIKSILFVIWMNHYNRHYAQCWKFPQVHRSEADNFGRGLGTFCWFFSKFYAYDLRFKARGPTTFLTEFQTLIMPHSWIIPCSLNHKNRLLTSADSADHGHWVVVTATKPFGQLTNLHLANWGVRWKKRGYQ